MTSLSLVSWLGYSVRHDFFLVEKVYRTLMVNAKVYIPLLGSHVRLVVRFMTIIGGYDCSLFPSFALRYNASWFQG